MHPLRAIGFKLLSVTSLVIMSSFIKASAVTVPVGEIVFFRSIFAIPVILGWMILTGHLRDGLTTRHPMQHFLRSLLGSFGMILGFISLGLLPLPEATTIGYAKPVLIVILAAVLLGERVGVFRLSAVGLGLTGVLIVASPGITGLGAPRDLNYSLGVAAALGAAFLIALAQIVVRRMVRTESTTAIVFYFTLTSATLGVLTSPWGWVWPASSVMLMLVLAGVLGGIGHILLTAAYRNADASIIAPFDYTSILLAVLIGYFVFAEVPSRTTIAGAALVIVAGVILILRERHLGLERRKQSMDQLP